MGPRRVMDNAPAQVLRRSGNFPPERRQRIENSLAVALRDQAPVKQGDNAAILLGTQKAAAGLDQLQRGVRHGNFHERVAATCLDPLGQRSFDRVVGHSKGNLGDDHVLAIRARQVDTLGKAGQAEQHAVLAIVDPRLVLVQGFLL